MAALTTFPQCQSLPANPYSQVPDTPTYDAYHQCVISETAAGANTKLLVYARCLGYLIIEAPDNGARVYLSHEILGCAGDRDRMNSLAEFYIHLFRLFRKVKGHASEHPGQPSFENERDFFSLTVSPAPKDYTAAKRVALERDNYRCMVTAHVDDNYWISLSADERTARNLSDATVACTNFCHIFPPSTNWDINPELPNDSKGTVCALMRGYARTTVLNEINGPDCHSLYNGLTLCNTIQEDFDRLSLWFEAIPNTQHTYRVCTLSPRPFSISSLPVHRTVTFTTTTNLPLPDPRYLKLHAIVCRVAHLSGVVRYLDMYNREQEERNALAYDGSSAVYLAWRLQDIRVV